MQEQNLILILTSTWYETMFRGYDPQIGRFKQVDPLADMFTDWTPYQYAYNDPIYCNDPLGLANGSGDSTWVSTSQLVQYLWDNTPEDGSATFEIVGFNPYGDEVGRTPTSDGVNIYHEGEFVVRATSEVVGILILLLLSVLEMSLITIKPY